MTRRCHHTFEQKQGYPYDLICMQCQRIWTVTDYLFWGEPQLLTLPPSVREKVRDVSAWLFRRPEFWLFLTNIGVDYNREGILG